MPGKKLKKKPLVEAVLEIKWALTSTPQGAVDTQGRLLLGLLYDRLRDNYPEHEQLPTAMLPDEMVGQVVQHRFRTGPGSWPLVQVGPGVLTVNDTQTYTWDDFRTRVLAVIDKYYNAHPKPSELKPESLLLRYIDAVDFNYDADDVYAFLAEKMKLKLSLPKALFHNTDVQERPRQLLWQSSFAVTNPSGMISLRFATGKKKDVPSLIWETIIQSEGNDIPTMPDSFEAWLDAAHAITEDWFFKLIEGELERRFSGD